MWRWRSVLNTTRTILLCRNVEAPAVAHSVVGEKALQDGFSDAPRINRAGDKAVGGGGGVAVSWRRYGLIVGDRFWSSLSCLMNPLRFYCIVLANRHFTRQRSTKLSVPWLVQMRVVLGEERRSYSLSQPGPLMRNGCAMHGFLFVCWCSQLIPVHTIRYLS